MDEKEIESLKDKLAEATEAIEALKAKNSELIAEKRKLQAKNGESVEMAKYEEAMALVEDLKRENEKLNKQTKAEFEKLQKSLSEKESALQKLIIDDGLTAQLIKVGIRPEMMETVKKAMRNDVSLKENNGAFEAVVGDKPLSEYIEKDWLPSQGQYFVQAPNNSGGGSQGSKANGGDNQWAKYFDKNSPDFNLTKQAELLQTNPTLYNQLKGN